MKRSTRRTDASISWNMPYRCAAALAATITMGLLLLLFSACIAYAQPDPSVLSRPLALLSLYSSVLIGGFIAAKDNQRPFLSALICGSGTVLVLMLLSLIPCGKSASTPSPLLMLGMYAGVVAVAAVGAVISIKKTKKRSSHRKSHRRR